MPAGDLATPVSQISGMSFTGNKFRVRNVTDYFNTLPKFCGRDV